MEFIGMFVGLAILSGISIAVGIGLAYLARIFIRRRSGMRARALLLGIAVLPLTSLIYYIAFSIAWGMLVPAAHQSFPGDFDEPLPNGYTLTGLTKMPHYARIERPQGGSCCTLIPSYISAIAVEGPLVFAAQRQITEDELKDPKSCDTSCFAFNTEDAKLNIFKTQTAMNAFAGHIVTLEDTETFRSHEPAVEHLRHKEAVFEAIPPLLASIFLFILAIRLRLYPKFGQ